MVTRAQARPVWHPAWKKPVKHIKPRTTTQRPLSANESQSTITKESSKTDTKASLENPPPSFRKAHDKAPTKSLLFPQPPPSSPISSPEITIEEYIISKKENFNSAHDLFFLRHEANHVIHDDASASSTTLTTLAAQDEAYSYLFQNLPGSCHGLNLVTTTTTASSASASGESPSSSTCARIAAVVYVQPGTACRNWAGIERGLERIFRKTTTTKAEDKEEGAIHGNVAAPWLFEGVIFVVWEAN